MNQFKRDTLRLYLVLGLALGAGLAVLLSGGCSTVKGLGRDIGGAFDGMMHVSDTNGQRVPSGR